MGAPKTTAFFSRLSSSDLTFAFNFCMSRSRAFLNHFEQNYVLDSGEMKVSYEAVRDLSMAICRHGLFQFGWSGRRSQTAKVDATLKLSFITARTKYFDQ